MQCSEEYCMCTGSHQEIHDDDGHDNKKDDEHSVGDPSVKDLVTVSIAIFVLVENIIEVHLSDRHHRRFHQRKEYSSKGVLKIQSKGYMQCVYGIGIYSTARYTYGHTKGMGVAWRTIEKKQL